MFSFLEVLQMCFFYIDRLAYVESFWERLPKGWSQKETKLSFLRSYTVRLQKNGPVSKVNKKSISHLTRAKRTPSAAATVPVSHALPVVRFSCLLRGRGVSSFVNTLYIESQIALCHFVYRCTNCEFGLILRKVGARWHSG